MTGSAFDLIIFDLDGVLIDSEVLSCGALAETLAEHGLPIGIDEVLDRFLGRSFSAVEEDFHGRTGAPLPSGFVEVLRTRLAGRFGASLEAMPGAAALLEAISLPFCLASSSDAGRVGRSLALTGLARFFEGRVFDAAMVARGKPAPDLFLFAAAAMEAAPARTLVIEDSENGVRAGKAAGMAVWGFAGGSHYAGRDGRAILSAAGADRIIDRLADLLPATLEEPPR